MRSFLNFVSRPVSIFVLAILLILFNGLLMLSMPKEFALDLKFAYSASDVFFALDSMGTDMREFYRIGIWLLDFPYMLVYTLFFTGVIYRLWGENKLLLLPVVIGFFDLLENVMVLYLLDTFPDIPGVLANMASFFTTSKWIFVLFMMASVLGGLIRMIIHRKCSTETASRYEI
ncbi:hypothetical protein [Algoriphagus hitonicola]|uniref:Uncharacterized protein n=1 Tax=Algoriphagus hitonicola TaxID=435880 RepID=A0A1I2T4R0_9BACT|nr:hypothetical protein [Algoriphagus hitonicola]SFG59788.1 hypothetical protein SAMN04487988_105208 [Algoriphagus hitonicola]